MMPWTLKFLWSPFLEMYRTKKFFVVITQLLSGLLFGLVAFSLKFDYFFAISISTMAVIAFSGATHDIACDGVYMAELSPADQAKYIGVQGAFYNIAKLVANGGLVAMAGVAVHAEAAGRQAFGRGGDAGTVGGDKEFLHKAPHLLLHLLHYPLPLCRRACDEDCTALLALLA